MGCGSSSLSAIEPSTFDFPVRRFSVVHDEKSLFPSTKALSSMAVPGISVGHRESVVRMAAELDIVRLKEFRLPSQSPSEVEKIRRNYRSNEKNSAKEIVQEFLEGRQVTVCEGLFSGFQLDSRKTCQDSIIVDYVVAKNGICFLFIGVFDGHGEHGDVISQRIARDLPRKIAKFTGLVRRNASFFDVIRKSFREMQKDLSKEFISATSGSTATCILMSDKTMYVSHLGDSLAHYLHSDDQLVTLTRPHHFDDETERLMIQRQRKGSIRRIQLRPGVEIGPLRIYAKGEEYPGLAMSRSFGDLEAHRVGVSAEPDFSSIDISDKESLELVAGSDGLWDEIDSLEFFQFMKYYTPIEGTEKAMNRILKEACRRWTFKQGGIVDDIACVFLVLGLPRTEEAHEFDERDEEAIH